MMEKPATKLLWVSEVAESATITRLPSSGIGVMVTEHTQAASGGPAGVMGGGMLGLPPSGKGSGPLGGGITPMEEFEPFEDAVMDEKEYEQLKVIKLLKQWNSYMAVRMLLPWTAGALALWATLGE